jgi:mRNA interferase MazF
MRDGTTFEQRDIVLIPFPYSNFSETKKRPVLIISNSTHHHQSNDIIYCAITSQEKIFEQTINIENKDLEFGNLHYDSAIKPTKIFTIQKKRIIKRLGRLNMNITRKVLDELKYFTNLE